MGKVTTIGLDIANSVFQVHGVLAAGTTAGQQKGGLRQNRLGTIGFNHAPRWLCESATT
jgi:hypothetical protein